MTREKAKGLFKIILGLLILMVMSSLVNRNQRLLLDYANIGYWGIFLSCLISNSTVFLPAPSITIVFTFASVYPPFIVATVGAFGAALGEVTGYVLGYSGRAVIDDKNYLLAENWTKRFGFGAIFLFAFLPLPLFDLVGVSSGVLRVPFGGFLISTFLGKWFKMLIYAYLGAGVIPWILPILSPTG